MLNPITIASAAPKAAPLDTPSRYGSTRGFLKMPWYTHPATANDAPTRAASMILGILISQTTTVVAISALPGLINSLTKSNDDIG